MFQILKVKCVKNLKRVRPWVYTKAGGLNILTFLCLIKPTRTLMKMKGSREDTKDTFCFFNKVLQNFLSHLVRPTFSLRTELTAFGIA